MELNNGKVAVITGGNDGIGKEMAKYIAKDVGTVVLGCRDLEKAEKAKTEIINESGNKNVIVLKLDLACFQSIRDFVDEFNRLNLPSLDILVNCSGVMMPPYSKTVDGFGYQFQINHLGPSLVTHLLLDKLNKSKNNPRILMLASRAHTTASTINLDDLDVSAKNYSAYYNYGFTKLCTILFTKELQRRLDETKSNIVVNCIHPGVVKTSLQRSLNWFTEWLLSWYYDIDVKESGKACARVALGTDENLHGIKAQYFEIHKVVQPSKLAQDKDIAIKLWIKTAEMLKIDPEIK